MHFRFEHFRGKAGRAAGSAIVAPLGFIANGANSTRYGEIAARLGCDVICPYRPALGPAIVERAERRTLRHRMKPSEFPELAAEWAAALGKVTQAYAWCDGLFDSGAGVVGAYAWAAQPHLFRLGIFRDAVNLNAPESVAKGAIRLAGHNLRRGAYAHDAHYPQQLGEGQAAESLMLRAGGAVQANQEALEWAPFAALRRAVAEASPAYYGRLMCSVASHDALLAVAARPTLAAAYIHFEDGLGGNAEQGQAFMAQLRETRAAAVSTHLGAAAGLLTMTAPRARHADLLNPSLMLEHLEQNRDALLRTMPPKGVQ